MAVGGLCSEDEADELEGGASNLLYHRSQLEGACQCQRAALGVGRLAKAPSMTTCQSSYATLLLPHRRREARVTTSAEAAADSTTSANPAVAAMVIAAGSALMDCSADNAAGALTQDDD